MAFEKFAGRALDYEPCHYGTSRLVFRGPKKRLDTDFFAFLGGTETYGRFIPEPFPHRIEAVLKVPCVNLGLVNAGVDVFLAEPAITEVAQASRVTVVQVMGAQNISNRFYRVHPRRNDRFIGASQMMQMTFREIDFSEFHFTRHMLGTLNSRAPERFALLQEELRQAWVARMQLLLKTIGGKIVLLWFSAHRPDEERDIHGLGSDPLFVDHKMIEALGPFVEDFVEVVASETALSKGTEGMCCSEMEKVAAQRMLGPAAHLEASNVLARSLRGHL